MVISSEFITDVKTTLRKHRVTVLYALTFGLYNLNIPLTPSKTLSVSTQNRNSIDTLDIVEKRANACETEHTSDGAWEPYANLCGLEVCQRSWTAALRHCLENI